MTSFTTLAMDGTDSYSTPPGPDTDYHSPIPQPPSEMLPPILPSSFALGFSNPLYSSISKSSKKYLRRMLKTDLESKIQDVLQDNDAGAMDSLDYTSNEEDPRFMITNLCDWIVQEIKKKCSKRKKGSFHFWDDFVAACPSGKRHQDVPYSGTREDELWFHVNLYITVQVG